MFLFDLGGYASVQFAYLGVYAIIAGVAMIVPFFALLVVSEWAIALSPFGESARARVLLLVFRSLRRNALRTALSFLAVFVLVFVVTLIWSVLAFLDKATEEKSKDLKAIVTERFQVPSQMPLSYSGRVMDLAAKLPADLRPKNGEDDMITWSFVGGTIDPANRTFENSLFVIALDPTKAMSMLDGLDEISEAERQELERSVGLARTNLKGVVVGAERLRILNKKVGDRVQLTCLNYQGIVLDLEIIGQLPAGRWEASALMNRDYLIRAMDEYKEKNKSPHPNESKMVNLVWIRLPTRAAFERLAEVVNSPESFSSPAVKMETAASGISSFFDAYRDLIWGMRNLLSPAILATMALVIANAISITVRERRTEMAVLKVLGFRPTQVMLMVLGEAMLVGVLAGAMATSVTYFAVYLKGGIPFPIAFFPKFLVPIDALWWGPAIGAGTAFAGAILPALSARKVKVSEVFARVA